MVGLGREAALRAFGKFLQGGMAAPDRIEFLGLLTQELTQTSVIEAGRLFESRHTPT